MVEEGQELIEEILELVDDLPERAEEFGDSVRDKVLSISKYLEEKNHITVGQITALQNMKAGIMKWLD